MAISVDREGSAGAEPVCPDAKASVAEIVRVCHDQGVDRALARWPSLTRDDLEPVLTYCAEQRCERDKAWCSTCRMRTLRDGLETFDAFVDRHSVISFRDTSVTLTGRGTIQREEDSLDSLADRWRGEEFWFLARRVLRKLRHGPRRARELVAAIEHVGDTPAIVLMEPQMAANVGMVARAMANFGLDELIVINPRDGWPSEKARILASGASAIVDGAVVASTLKEGMGPLNWICATTARQRELVKPVLSPEEAAKEMRRRIAEGQRCGILFGRERNGLTSDELANADAL
ncbi:MAG TPA: RNA methyltransferase, partial [Hyphomicrobiaceae bacterium]|nr:RNA methyltransferase [Hyphomicrobiaceae bacterium]